MTLPLPLRLCLLGIMAPALSEASQTQSLDVPHSSPTKGNIPVAQKHYNGIESDGFITIWKNDFEARNFMNCSDMCNGIDKFPVIDTLKNGNSYLDLLNQELDLAGTESNNHSNDLNTLALASELKKLSEDHKQIHDSATLIRMSGCSDSEFNGATSRTMGLTKANTGLSNNSDFNGVKDTKVVIGNCDKLNSEKLQISIFGSPGLVNVFDNSVLDIMEESSASPQQNNQFDQGSHSTYESESLEHHNFLPDIDVMSIIDDNLVENLVGDQRELVVKDRKEDLEKRHHEIERKCERILRRLYKVQSRGLSDHISHQLCKYVDYAHKTLNIPRSSVLKEREDCRAKEVQDLLQRDNVKLLSTSALVDLVKKLEMEPDSVTKSSFKSPHDVLGGDLDKVTVKFSDPVKKSIESTCGNLLQQLKRTAKVTDPDLTASSSGSGGESSDEFENMSRVDKMREESINSVPLQKRALWRWATERAKISSRWAWLRSQIVDLDHKIKDYSELYRNMLKDKQHDWFMDKPHSRLSNVNCVVDSHSYSRTSVNIQSVNSQCVDLECPPSAEPLSSLDIDDSCQSCRVRPIKPVRKRKYIHTNGLYATSEKSARPCKFTCGCLPPLAPCILCGGKRRNVVDVDSDLSFNDKVGIMDPDYHPVLSFTSDIPLHLYFNAKLHNLPKNFGFQNKSRSAFRKSEPSDKKYTIKAQDYYKENGRNTFRKYKRSCGALDYDDEKKSSRGNSPNSNEGRLERRERLLSHSHEVPRRKRQDSAYDIDNIVIPYSIASSARVEKLPYKEILTPGWREVAEVVTDFNFQANSSQNGESTEDTSDDAIALRHRKLELDEKQRFGTAVSGQSSSTVGSGRGRPRRIDSRADSSGTNTPDPMSPYPLDPNADSYCSPLGTPPSTPRSDCDVLLLGQHSKGERRHRTTSNNQRRVNYQDDSRCSTPLLECDDYVQPYSPRVFPLNEEESLELIEKLTTEMTTEHEGITSNCDPLISDPTLVDLGDLQGKATSNGHDAGCSNPG